MKSDRHRWRSRRWRGKVNRQRSCPSQATFVVQHDEVVALTDGREVPVDDGSLEQGLGVHPIEPVAQPRPSLDLDEFFIGRAGSSPRSAQPPLAHERGPFVEERRVLSQRYTADDAVAQERRRRDRVVDSDVGAIWQISSSASRQGDCGADPTFAQGWQLGAGDATS